MADIRAFAYVQYSTVQYSVCRASGRQASRHKPGGPAPARPMIGRRLDAASHRIASHTWFTTNWEAARRNGCSLAGAAQSLNAEPDWRERWASQQSSVYITAALATATATASPEATSWALLGPSFQKVCYSTDQPLFSASRGRYSVRPLLSLSFQSSQFCAARGDS